MKRAQDASPVTDLTEQALHRPVREFIGTRGKRLRGALVKLSYATAGGKGKLPNEIYEAIEWLHAGSLVIDDVQDGSCLRRERPTLHRQIGVPLAINAGNYMYFRALEIAASTPIAADLRCQITAEMIRAGRMCHEGQAIDLAAQVDALPNSDWLQVAQAISVQKTGVLVDLAMRLGAIAAAAGPPLLDELGRFGRQVGVALQMRNDLDELAAAAAASLTDHITFRSDDLRNRRVTWTWAWLSETCDASTCRSYALRLRAASQANDDSALCTLANDLLMRIQEHGESIIRQQIAGTVRLLGEYVVDDSYLSALRDCLRPIECGPCSSSAPTVGSTETPL